MDKASREKATQLWVEKINSIDDPEEREAVIAEIKRISLIERCKQDNPDGVYALYELMYDRTPPEHTKTWVEAVFYGSKKKRGVLIEAFRGGTKSTTMECFICHQIGHHPEKNNLVISSADQNGTDFAASVANLIEFNAEFKDAFPHVKPDKDRGWGESGYEVMRTDMDYNDWRKLRDKRGRKNSLIGASYKSKSIIGSHPDGVFLIDDYHDENNTRSLAAREEALDIYKGTLVPMLEGVAHEIVIGTPWTTTDLLALLKDSGIYHCVNTPVYTKDENGKIVLTWGEKFTQEMIDKIKAQTGSLEFARMYLLDLTAAENFWLKKEWLHRMPLESIDPEWPFVIGVDYASSADLLKGSDTDYTCIAVGRIMPKASGIVLIDGFRGRLSQAQAEEKIVSLNKLYRPQKVGIESVGTGRELAALIMRSESIPVELVSPGRKSKGLRFEKHMAPLFETKRAWIAENANSDFITHFEREWSQYPNGRHDDTLDAVYWMLYVGAPHMFKGLSKNRDNDDPWKFNFMKKKKSNPWKAMANG